MTDLDRAKKLWQLLDDIDTMDDIARDDDKRFRASARIIVSRRHSILKTDGYELEVPSSSCLLAGRPSPPIGEAGI